MIGITSNLIIILPFELIVYIQNCFGLNGTILLVHTKEITIVNFDDYSIMQNISTLYSLRCLPHSNFTDKGLGGI